MDVYRQIDDLEADANYWESKAKGLVNLLKETRNLLVATQNQGTLPITEVELRGLISTIDEEVVF